VIRAQNGRTGMISTWIFVGSSDGTGEESVRRGRARRRYADDASKAIEIVCVARVILCWRKPLMVGVDQRTVLIVTLFDTK